MANDIRITPENKKLFWQLLQNHDRIKRYRAKAEAASPWPAPDQLAAGTTVRMYAAPKPAATKGKKKAASAFHELRRQLDERAFYPPHGARQSSPEYRKVHEKMVNASGCIVCDVRNDILQDPEKREDLSLNPYGAKQLETHHHVIEWALANAIDAAKFNKRILPFLQKRHGTQKYPGPLSPQDVADWVDHSEDNLWVLCDVHHRAPFFGIHEITDPIWGPQDILSDEFLAKIRTEIGKDGGKKKGKSRKAAKKKSAKKKKSASRRS